MIGILTKPRSDRDDLIQQYREYVQFVVGKMVHSMSLPASMFDEFVSAGYLGLVEAAERYDESTGVEFRNFAFLRIRGAVIDSIRQCSYLSGKAYRYVRALQASHSMREDSFSPAGNDPDFAEICEYVAKGGLTFRMSLMDADSEVNDLPSPDSQEELVSSSQQRAILCRLIATLPEKERIIIEDYYFRGKSFAEIARGSGLMSKSWVSRLHSKALKTLKELYEREVPAV